MLHRNKKRGRPGTTMVENAFVLPVVFLLIIGLIVLGLGIFRYHEVGNLAREGARYALVHGGDYFKEIRKPTNQAPVTAEDITNYIKAKATGLELDSSHFTVLVEIITPDIPQNGNWNGTSYKTIPWDGTLLPNSPARNNGNAVTNIVSVTITYRWFPEAYLGLFPSNPMVLTSRSEMPMAY